jgi:thioredoxin 1
MRRKWRTVLLASVAVCVLVTPVALCLAKDRTVEEAYPGLASGILKAAALAELKDGAVLTSGKLSVPESEVLAAAEKSNPATAGQLKKNLFFLLEQMVMERLLLAEAKGAGFGAKGEDSQEAIEAFLASKASRVTVTDDECRRFYDQNREMIPGVPFDQAKEAIRTYVMQRKSQELVGQYVRDLFERTSVQVDSRWAEKQSALALDNPVDKARRSGIPTLVEFGATGCKPCDMMQPILDNLRKKYKEKLNVVFLHVGEEQILAARFGIQSIPVQGFYDKTGKEVFRHEGFFPQAEIEKKLVEMGVK